MADSKQELQIRNRIVNCFSGIEISPSINTVDNLEKLINQQVREVLGEVKKDIIGPVPSKMNTDNWKYDRRVAELKQKQHKAIDDVMKGYLP